MMRTAVIASFLVFLPLLSGCFIGVPSAGTAAHRQLLGREFKLGQDVLLITYFGELLAWPARDEKQIGSGQQVSARIPAGASVKIEGIKKYRMPAGIEYGLRCSSPVASSHFTIPSHFQKTLGVEVAHGDEDTSKKY